MMSLNSAYLDAVCEPLLEHELDLDGGISGLIEDMFEICDGKKCIGLAANQVGVRKQLMVINCQGFRQVFINPMIERSWGGATGFKESCLSYPGKSSWCIRPKRILVVGVDQNWEKLRFKPRGLVARAIQHEYDHLQGINMFKRKALGVEHYG